jgi:ABC-type amino acid transport system permease subunit
MRLPTLRQAPSTNPDSIDAHKTLSIQLFRNIVSAAISATISSIHHPRDMKFIHFIANAFINTMGITQPSPQAANRAAWFIVIMLSAVLAAVVTIAVVAIHLASHP